MLHALTAAALLLGSNSDDACAALTAPVESADRLFTQSDDALKRGDGPAANSAYSAGMQQLVQSPWRIPETRCDPPHYTYERYVVSLHSLVAGVATGAMDPVKAFQFDKQMWKDITTPPDGSVTGQVNAATYLDKHYPDLLKRAQGYVATLEQKSDAAKIALHAPASEHCATPEVEPEYIGSVFSYQDFVAPDVPEGRFEAVVLVTLGADGKVLDAAISKSSGDKRIDRNAVSQAREQHYLPKISACKAIASTYLYEYNVQITRTRR